VGLGLLGGVLGLALRSRWLMALLVAPAVYLAFVLLGTASLRGISPAARLRLPVVLIVMHLSWGLGFLRGLPDASGPRRK
jgi:hypothetical protein